MDSRIRAWIDALRRLGGEPPPVGTRLGAGPVDGPLLAAVRGERWEPQPAPIPSGTPSAVPVDADAALWRAVHRDGRVPAGAIEIEAGGPLLARGPYRTVEVWTESELCALHALGKLVRTDPDPRWHARLAAARSWHLEHTQPDNATNRPWSIQVFVAWALLEGGPAESLLYGETLLHNALAMSGRPEPLAAAILLDAAAELERRVASVE